MKRPTRPLVEERGQHCEAHVDFGFIVHTASATRQDQVLLHLFRDDLLARTRDGTPGIQAIWQGYQRLHDFIYAIEIYRTVHAVERSV